jgi:cell division topological specificity factor MinE
MNIFSYFRSQKKQSAQVAKERLQVIVARERTHRGGPDYLPQLQEEILKVVRRYVQESLAIPASGDANRLDEWLTQYGGGLYATSVGGGLTGKGIDGVAVVDDPIKNREEAESPRIREKIASWFGDVVMTRLERNASVIVIMTRWHPGDLIGELSGTGDWETINIPALRTDADGVERALLPAYPDGAPAYPVARLHELRRQLGDYSFASLYQGMPRPRGGTVFGEATTCALADVPSQGRDFIGVDLAYTARTHADWSTAVVLRTQRYKDDEGARRTRCWVVDVLRRQERASDFVRRLQHLERAHPGAPMVWHGSTTERGGADAIRELGLPQLRPMLATGDKFVRSQPVAAAWNAGDVWVPRDAPWSTAFLDEVQSFTGVGDRTDDQVDALASAFSSVATTPSSDIKTGRRAKFGRSARSAF